jgi:hypothetical protein
MAARRPNWRFAVKIHPRYDHPGLYERVNRALPPERRFRVYVDEPLETLAPECDVVVACNVVTSALIEASLHGIPVVQMRAAMCWYDEKAWGLDRWRHVDSVAELETELEAVLENPMARLEAAADTRAALADFLDGAPQPSARRCVEIIREMAKRSVRAR